MAASLETQKGAVFAQIMQISARILEMQGGQGKIWRRKFGFEILKTQKINALKLN